DVGVIGSRDADIDGAIGAGEPLRYLAAAFQRLPGQFQQQALLRIHLLDLARGEAEERGVESGDVAECAGAMGIRLARQTIAVKEVASVPSVRGNFRDGIALIDQKLPKRFRRVSTAWKPASVTNDCYRVALCHPNGLTLGVNISCECSLN